MNDTAAAVERSKAEAEAEAAARDHDPREYARERTVAAQEIQAAALRRIADALERAFPG